MYIIQAIFQKNYSSDQVATVYSVGRTVIFHKLPPITIVVWQLSDKLETVIQFGRSKAIDADDNSDDQIFIFYRFIKFLLV